MEELGQRLGNCDFHVRVAEIAAAGNKPQDWKKYIEDVKLEVQSWGEYRRNRIILFIYYNAFKVIPESDKSLDHAQLLIEYAELKSIQNINGAEKMLAYGRRILPHFAIIYVASAKLELARGNKEKAVRILMKGSMLEAEPSSVISLALHQLQVGRLEDVTDNTMNGRRERDSMRDPSETLSEVIPALPGYKSCTLEVQPDLDLLTSMSVTGQSQCQQQQAQHQQQFESPQDDVQVPKSPEPPVLLQWKYSERTRDSTYTSSATQMLDRFSSHSCLPETPQHLPAARDLGSTSKRTMTRFSSTPDMRLPTGCDSIRKFRPSNLGPPRRVKVDPAIKSMGEEERESHTGVIAGPLFGFTDSWQSDKGHNDISCEETPSGTLKDISNTRYSYEDISQSASNTQSSNLFSSTKVSPAYGFPFAIQNQQNELSAPLSNLSYDQPKVVDTIQLPARTLPSRKLQQFLNRGTMNMSRREETQSFLDCHPIVQDGVAQQDMRAESTQEMLDKQKLVPKQQQLVPEKQQQFLQQQLIQQQQQFLQQQSTQQRFAPQQQFVQHQLIQHQQTFVQQQFTPQHQPFVHHQQLQVNPQQQIVHQQQLQVNQQQQIVHQQQLQVNPQQQIVHQQQLQANPQQQVVHQQQLQVNSQQQIVHQEQLQANPQQQVVHQQLQANPQQQIVHQQLQANPQQQIVHKQLQANQQQQFVHQQQSSNIDPRTFSVPAHQPAIATDNSVSVIPGIMTGKKIIYVNGKPYAVMALAGRGGSAKVYQVHDPGFKVLALKCVNLAGANSVVVQGYRNEIDLLRKLQHCERVIKLYDFEYLEASKKLLAVLEYGETDLGSFISQNNKGTKIDPVTMRYLWLQMVSAVHAMHKEGVIHSDLKPANFIMVSGKVKLIDFGIANSLQQDNTSVLKEIMVGTPSYMSPEALIAISTNPADPKPKYKVGVRSDVWSLGCILYQLTYGHTPFQNLREKVEAVVNPNHEIPFPEIEDASLMDVLKKCLTRDVIGRPTPEELLKHAFLNKF